MKDIFADIITIGDEILYGQITDTNSQWVSAELDTIGIRTKRKSSVGDQEEAILEILSEAEGRSQIIIITGGLGPTNDDITKKTLCKYFNSSLTLNQEALEEVTNFFKSKGRDLNELNRQQAFLPENCEYIPNKSGTAPGMWFEKDGKVFISMPGVPHEMKAMMQTSILPKLKQTFKTPIIFHRVIKTVGIGESYLSELIKPWEDALPSHIKLAYLPSLSQVKLRLTASGVELESVKKEVDDQINQVLPVIKEYVFGYDNDLLEKVIGQLLHERKMTIATAESCTGGYVAYLITSIPGSSEYFLGSTVAYQNEIKMKVLGVEDDTLAKHGAVSEETVREMAAGVRSKFDSDIGIATTGLAGPSGGDDDQPVGTIWIGYSDKNQTIAKKLRLGNDRDVNIKLTSIALFNFVRQTLLKNS